MLHGIISNAQHPEYGVATIPFPIPDEEYDYVMELLDALEIGDAVRRVCHVEEITGTYPVLKCLEGTEINIDEMDFLAKRLDSFADSEKAQFQGMAAVRNITELKDLIDLTFCCQRATVITDFSDLEAVGRAHFMNLYGSYADPDEIENLDGYETALLLIESGSGKVTPYGLVFENGMELKETYQSFQMGGMA